MSSLNEEHSFAKKRYFDLLASFASDPQLQEDYIRLLQESDTEPLKEVKRYLQEVKELLTPDQMAQFPIYVRKF